LKFRPGKEILDPQLVQIHGNLCHDAAEVQAEDNRWGGRRDKKALNFARAILEDLEGYLRK
jgi:hypothetical protein